MWRIVLSNCWLRGCPPDQARWCRRKLDVDSTPRNFQTDLIINEEQTIENGSGGGINWRDLRIGDGAGNILPICAQGIGLILI